MPAKKRLVPPLRPNADGSGFVQAFRGRGPAHNRSSGAHRPIASTSSSGSSTSSSASSCSLSAAEPATLSHSSVGRYKARGERRRSSAAALLLPQRKACISTSAEDHKGHLKTTDTKYHTAVTQGLSPLPSAPASVSAVDSLLSASPVTGSPTKKTEQHTAWISGAASRSTRRSDVGAPAGKARGVAPAMLTIGVDGALGPSECLLATSVMHRLGLQSGHIVRLSTSYGDVYAGVRPKRGSAVASDKIFVNEDAAAVLVDVSPVVLCPVLLPQNGVPTLRSVTLTMVVPENARDANTCDAVVPSIASTMEWQALFRRTLHHKIAYLHLRTTQRVLTHRIALEVVNLSVASQGEESSTSAAESDAAWGIVTDATEVRFYNHNAAAGVSIGRQQCASTGLGRSAVETCQEGVPFCSGCLCTLVVGGTGVGKSRWLSLHAPTAFHTEQQRHMDASTSPATAAGSRRYTEWVHVDQLPQGEGSEVTTATALHEVFERARQSAPATVAIDDLHLICGREASSAGSRWAMSLIAHALAAELLDLQSRRLDVGVIASAPTLASLDACLTVATLFGGSVVTLEMPSGPQERLACLRMCLLELRLNDSAAGPGLSEACLLEVAERAHGFTQRDLHRLVETAVMQAFQTRQSIVPTDADLRAASAIVHPSSLKHFEVSVPTVTWADIGGSAEAKQTLCDVVDWCLGKQSWLFTEFNLTPPKGVLLYGPPGCSKTMLAKALANESRMNFISVKGPEVFSKWVGDSEKAVRDIFERARAASPCVVFIDELDGMCGHRGRGGVSDRVISQFLTELDGLPAAFGEKKRALVFVAATNRPDSIDGAVLRPGRIDRRVYVGLPTLPERCAITDIQFKHLPVAGDLTAHYVAERTEGYTGAEVVAVVKEAAFHAITVNASACHVTLADIDAALQKVRPRISAKDVEWYKHWPNNRKTTTACV
ncbi:AAA family ATPase-like protein [Leishmania guyanensis]